MREAFVSLYKKVRLFVLLTVSYVKTNRRLFIIGLALGLFLLTVLPKFFHFEKKTTIGLAGDYTLGTLPLEIQKQISFGLTKTLPDGSVASAAAKSWEITNAGKTITFKLNDKLHWQNGEKFTSEGVNYNLKSVQLTRPSPDTVQLTLQEPFAPLLSVVSQPLFKNGLMGLGQWQVEGLNFSGRFISQISLVNTITQEKEIYKFFSNEEALITALKLGLVGEAQGLRSLHGLETDKHYQITSAVNGKSVATLFFNLQNDTLADKPFRQALTYALPDDFPEGPAANAPVALGNWSESVMAKKYPHSLDLAKKLLGKSPATSSGRIKLTIATSQLLEETAKEIAPSWKELGIDTQIEVFDVPPPNYDVFLTMVELPTDPDQYFLWHSTQSENIAHYKSPKVDKLLEDGRKTLDLKSRKEIYANFERAITEDVPAAFLFYPKLYTIKRT